MGPAELAAAAAHLDEHGWAVVPRVVSAEACAASRAMMDAHLGPPAKDVNVLGDRAAAAAAAGGVWGATPWPSFLACGPGHDHMPTCTGFDGLQCPM